MDFRRGSAEEQLPSWQKEARSVLGDQLVNFKLGKKEMSSFLQKVKNFNKPVEHDYEFIDHMVSMIPFEQLSQFKSDQEKSNLKAKVSRDAGNDNYSKGNMTEALEYYTKSIANAEAGSEDLGLAFGNRSAVLFEKQYFQECIQDVKRAFDNNYPVEKRDKLTTRKAKAETSLELQKLYRYHDPPPEIKNKHPHIAAAADCFEINQNEVYGRHVVASRNIKAGELVVVEKPFVKAVKHMFRTLYCSECTELCYNMIPCDECTEALYCSIACKESALKKYHHYECQVVRAPWYSSSDDVHLALFLRLSILGLEEYEDLKTTEANGIYRSDRFKEINELCTNREKFSVQECLKHAFRPSLVYRALVETDILSKITGTDDLEEKKNILKDVLFKNYLITTSNITGINTFSKARYESKYVAGAINSFTSLFNHACNQNLDSASYGDTVALYAHKNIKKGEQCFVNYSTTLVAEAKKARAERLKEYYFTCTCTPCNENWPTKITLLIAGYRRAPAVARVEDQFIQDKVTPENMQKFLQDCFRAVKNLKNEPECGVNQLSLSNLIRICIASLSNKDLTF